MTEEYCYTVSALVNREIETVFDYLQDPIKLGKWSLGCFDTKVDTETGLCTGHSLFNGKTSAVEIASDEGKNRIEFRLGPAGKKTPRIVIQVNSGGTFGYPGNSSLVTMTAWRTAGMTDYEWERLKRCHDVEILMLREQIENLIP